MMPGSMPRPEMPSSSFLPVRPRRLGASPTDLETVLARELERTLSLGEGRPDKALHALVDQARAGGWITTSDVRRLREVCDAVFAVHAGARLSADVVDELERLYCEMILDPQASELATDLVGASYSAGRGVEPPALVGLFVGALLGLLFCQNYRLGMAIGVLLGPIVGEACRGELA